MFVSNAFVPTSGMPSRLRAFANWNPVSTVAATSFAPDVDSASAALPLVAVLLSFVSGIFVPVDNLPSRLAAVGRVFAARHFRWEPGAVAA